MNQFMSNLVCEGFSSCSTEILSWKCWSAKKKIWWRHTSVLYWSHCPNSVRWRGSIIYLYVLPETQNFKHFIMFISNCSDFYFSHPELVLSLKTASKSFSFLRNLRADSFVKLINRDKSMLEGFVLFGADSRGDLRWLENLFVWNLTIFENKKNDHYVIVFLITWLLFLITWLFSYCLDDALIEDIIQCSGQEFTSHLYGTHHTTHPQWRWRFQQMCPWTGLYSNWGVGKLKKGDLDNGYALLDKRTVVDILRGLSKWFSDK